MRTFARVQQVCMFVHAHVYQGVSMRIIVSVGVACDCHGSVIALITTAGRRNRLPFSAAVTEKRAQVDKPRQQI